MSRLDELIRELCPNGVEYKKIDELAQISAGGDLPENYVKGQNTPTEKYPYPIYSNGTADGALYGYTDNYKIEEEAITISARGTIGHHEIRRGKFTPIVRLITLVAVKSIITTKFLNYALCVAGIEGVTTGIPSLTVPMLKKFAVPVPPLPVQEEIVRILDNFTELTAELIAKLTAELLARKKQYEYYRDGLLNTEYDTVLFGDVATIVRGASPRPIKDFVTDSDDGVNWIKIGDVKPNTKYITTTKEKITKEGAQKSRFVKQGDFILSNSMSFGRPYIIKNEGCIHDGWLLISGFSELYIPDFLYHLLNSNMLQNTMKQKASNGGAVSNLNADIVKSLELPLVPLKEQKRIVDILDRFDMLCNDISVGLPAEIDARTKQYEFYRNKLLTFYDVGGTVWKL